jgi:hypothetical protein
VVNASQPQVTVICTHERRPGTTVCLHCRHASLLAARGKRKRLMLRGGAVVIVLGTFIAAGTVGATAIRGKSAARKATIAARQAPAEVVAVADGVSAADTSAVTVPGPAVQQGEVESRGEAPLRPIVPTGAAPLRDGMSTLRSDSVVTVLFDTPGARTRIPEKFERLVRETLPAVYGRGVDSVLAKMPQGAIAKQGLLASELATNGVLIPIGNAWSIRLFPETRLGQDGPLVVRYRVSVVSQND